MSINGMSINGMSLNGMSINGTSLNGMSINGSQLTGVKSSGTADLGHRLRRRPHERHAHQRRPLRCASTRLSPGRAEQRRVGLRRQLPVGHPWSRCAARAATLAIPLAGTWNHGLGRRRRWLVDVEQRPVHLRLPRRRARQVRRAGLQAVEDGQRRLAAQPPPGLRARASAPTTAATASRGPGTARRSTSTTTWAPDRRGELDDRRRVDPGRRALRQQRALYPGRARRPASRSRARRLRHLQARRADHQRVQAE